MKKIGLIVMFLVVAFTFSCVDPEITDAMLDGDVIFDPSLYTPENYLVSAKYPNPTAADLNRHIIMAIHGYSSTTFEWQEFADLSVDSTYRISQVLLDGHGTTYQDFKASTWKDWSHAIKQEYEKLIALGYKKISLVGSSTGGTLILELVSSGYFNARQSPKNLFLIDPIVVPSNKVQTIAGIVGPMIVYIEVDQTAQEDKYWYHFRPQETVNELNSLMKVVRKDLEEGVTLPTGTYLKEFHSLHDPVASTTSAVLIYKGLKTSTGAKIDVQLMDSDIHVFTRLSFRKNVTTLQIYNQQSAFAQIASRLK